MNLKKTLFAIPIALALIGTAIAWAGWYNLEGDRALIRGFIDLIEQGTAPGTPSADVMRVYAAVDGTTTKLYFKDQVGTAYSMALNDRATTPLSVTATTDITATEDATGGNAGARSQIQGLPKVDLVSLGTMTNGTTGVTLSLIDDSPTGEFVEVDAGTNVVLTADTSYYRVGTTSLKIAFAATAVAGDGASDTISSESWEDEESVGVWVYSNTGLTAGDMSLVLTDDGGARTYTFPVVTAGVWTWIEIDITALAGGTGDAITAVKFLLTTQGATNLGATNVYLDDGWKWNLDNEETLGRDLVQDGVLSVLTNVNADAGTQAHEKTRLTEGTDYFIHYQTGNDAIVLITDQSTKDGIALIAFK